VLGRLALGFADGAVTDLLIALTAATTVFSGFAYLVRWARILARVEQAL
jgi:hypothetical protein